MFNKFALAMIIMLGCMTGATQASSIVMEGYYIRTAVSENGTLGYGGHTSPGILYDATGTGTFGSDDYLTPGTPFEGFTVSVDGRNYTNNNNPNGTSGEISKISINDISAGSSNAVIWSGERAGLFTITNRYSFADTSENIQISTTLTALRDIDNLTFARVLDPDPDVRTYGSYGTVNGLGLDANSDGDFDDAGDIKPGDWSYAEGSRTGLTIGLFSNSNVTHAAGVDAGWSMDPATYLNSVQDDGNGDYVIAMAFDVGSLLTGEKITLEYVYGMGETLSTTTPAPVPLPAAAWLFGSGLIGLIGIRRKSKSIVK